MNTNIPSSLVLSPAAELQDLCLEILYRLLVGRPTHVSHPSLELIVAAMRTANRTELVHYAGACHRDQTAWYLCLAWLSCPAATESELLNRAYAASGWNVVPSPAEIRAGNPGMA